MRILIAEDDLGSRVALAKLLSSFGQCDVAENGREAFSCFKKALSEGAPYELVCLDIMMPELDGQQVLRKIRSEERGAGIGGLDAVRVIMISALDDSGNILGAFKGGCEAYLHKPLDKDKLIGRMRDLGLVSM